MENPPVESANGRELDRDVLLAKLRCPSVGEILEHILDHPGTTNQVLQSALSLTQPTISNYVAELQRIGVVVSQREGRHILLFVPSELARDVRETMKLLAGGRAREAGSPMPYQKFAYCAAVRDIIQSLLHEEQSVMDICAFTGQSQPNVSAHLKDLRESGIVVYRKADNNFRKHVYKIVDRHRGKLRSLLQIFVRKNGMGMIPLSRNGGRPRARQIDPRPYVHLRKARAALQRKVIGLLLERGSLTVSALAKNLKIDQSAISALFKTLSGQGFVEFRTDEHDRRIRYYSVSAQHADGLRALVAGKLLRVEAEPDPPDLPSLTLSEARSAESEPAWMPFARSAAASFRTDHPDWIGTDDQLIRIAKTVGECGFGEKDMRAVMERFASLRLSITP